MRRMMVLIPLAVFALFVFSGSALAQEAGSAPTILPKLIKEAVQPQVSQPESVFGGAVTNPATAEESSGGLPFTGQDLALFLVVGFGAILGGKLILSYTRPRPRTPAP